MSNHPKTIRKKILEILYDYRQEGMVDLKILQERLVKAGFELDDRTLHGEIIYLEDKGYLDIMGKFCGREYLHFHALRITSYGVDLVEDPEEFNKLFTVKINHIGNILNSNVAIDSPHSNQKIDISELSPELQQAVKDLEKAIQEKDDKKVFDLLAVLKDGAKNVFWNIVSTILINLPK